VLVLPQAAAMLIGGSVHTAAEPPSASHLLVANSMIWATVALVAIYLTWRSGQPLSSIGFRRENPVAAIGAGIVATIAIYAAVLVTALTVAILTRTSRETMTAPAREILDLLGPPSWLMTFAIAGTAGVFEEIVFRGFLLTRLRVVLGGWTAAIAVGALLFAVPHIWQGRWAVVLILPVAAVLSMTFVLRRSVIAPILAHFLFNFLQLATIRVLQDSPEWQRILNSSQ
jgi:membrane protease YdiL (CAAX protease family)